jgi:hypothetical protein
MATAPRSDALTTLRDRLAAHARDPRASMFGLASTLQALDAAMLEQAKHQADLASSISVVEAHVQLLQRVLTGQCGARFDPPFTDDTRERLRVIFEAART